MPINDWKRRTLEEEYETTDATAQANTIQQTNYIKQARPDSKLSDGHELKCQQYLTDTN